MDKLSPIFDKISGELEGIWHTSRKDLHKDESLEYCQQHFPKSYKKARDGEINTDYLNRYLGELIPKQPFDNLESMLKWVKDEYPNEVSVKCGYHIHVSLKDISAYSTLLSEKFHNYFIQKMREWGKENCITNEQFWDRLDSKNKYCKNLYHGDYQVTMKEKGINNEHRRTFLNYCYGIYGTLECRLFPAFQCYETAQSATIAFLTCIESFLSENKVIDLDQSSSILIEESDAVQEINLNDLKSKYKLRPFNYFTLKNKSDKIKDNNLVYSNLEEIVVKEKLPIKFIDNKKFNY